MEADRCIKIRVIYILTSYCVFFAGVFFKIQFIYYDYHKVMK